MRRSRVIARLQGAAILGVCGVVATASLVATGGAADAAGRVRYVAVTGSDADNDCLSAASPCLHIQVAIDQADAGDTVSVGAGTYDESLHVRRSINLIGAGVAKTVVVGSADTAILIDGRDTDATPVVVLSSLAASQSAGDGVDVDAATATLSGVAVGDNEGDGLNASGSTVHVLDSVIKNNRDDGLALGGGSLTIRSSSVVRNGAAGVRLAAGANSTTESAVDGNAGGGVVVNGGSATVRRSRVSGNLGAGVVATSSASRAEVASSTVDHTKPFTSSEPFGGGVLALGGGSVTVLESTLAANTNFGLGVDGGSGRILNSTVTGTSVGPTPSDGLVGGLGAVTPAPSGLTAIGTISAGNAQADCHGTVHDGGYNLDADGSCHLTATGSRPKAQAMLGSLAGHGGPTPTILPAIGSPARNAIPFGAAGCVQGAHDQRGQARRSPAGGRCDIGSVEATVKNPTITARVTAPRHHDGWYYGTTTVTYTCTLGTARLTRPCPRKTVIYSSGTHRIRRTIHAADGGSATLTLTVRVRA